MMRVKSVLTGAAVLAALLAGDGPALAADAGYALRFDGASDYVTFATTASMMAPTWTTTKSVALWVNPTGTPLCTGTEPATCDAIFGDRPRSWGIVRGVIGGLDRIWIWNYDGSMDKVGIEYTVGVWTHIALVHGGGQLSAYKNGVLVGSVASGPTSVVTTGTVLQLGGIISNAQKNATFQGEIDEVQLWNSALSGSDILYAMNNNLVGNEAGLAAYYRMSNGSGGSVTDDSGHGWTGTLRDGTGDVPPDGPIVWVPSGAFGGTTTPNNPPAADPQSVNTAEDAPVSLVLSGADPDGNPLTFRIVTAPIKGALTGTAPNLTYTPGLNYHGTDAFTFVVNDGWADSPVAIVSLAVTPVNDSPVAVNDAITTPFETALVVSVLDNDSDVDGDGIVITEVGAPANGTAVADVNQITYTPNVGYLGSDTFTYTITDNNGGFATAQVSVTVRAPGADPVYSLAFDGISDFVKLSYTVNMMAPGWQGSKTVELWVKPTLTAPPCTNQIAAACDAIFGDRPRWWGISQGVVGGLDRIWVYTYDGHAGHGETRLGIEYTPNQWVHVALVHEGGVLYAYKNGVMVGSVAADATGQPGSGAQPVLQLGGVINTVQRNWTFKGELDEVRIWNGARTAEELVAHMVTPLEGTEPNLAAYYRMTDGIGTSLSDDSGHGWTGTLTDGINGVPPDGPIQWVPSGAFAVP